MTGCQDDGVTAQNAPVPARGRTPSQDVSQALVDAAEVVLVRDGPSAVTVRAVAAEASVAPMGVYNHFGGKEGLVDALLVRGFDGLRAAVAPRDGGQDPLEELRSSGIRYREFALANPHHYAVMFEGAIPREGESPVVQEHAGAAFGELVGIVATTMGAGLIRPGEPQELAQQIWSTVHGAVALELKGLILTPDPVATYRALLDLVLRGLT